MIDSVSFDMYHSPITYLSGIRMLLSPKTRLGKTPTPTLVARLLDPKYKYMYVHVTICIYIVSTTICEF
jgi:hypothetical protein